MQFYTKDTIKELQIANQYNPRITEVENRLVREDYCCVSSRIVDSREEKIYINRHGSKVLVRNLCNV